MGVINNPYRQWETLRENSDYRTTDTQAISYVRQQLSQSEYLRDTNRVNMGPLRNKRASESDLKPQIPSVFGSEDMWGFQFWAVDYPELLQSDLITGEIYEASTLPIAGTSYYPYNKVGGATHIHIDKVYRRSDFTRGF